MRGCSGIILHWWQLIKYPNKNFHNLKDHPKR